MNRKPVGIFCVLGQDGRQLAAAEYLRGRGYTLVEQSQISWADYLLLPMPLSLQTEELQTLFEDAKPGLVAFAGKVSRQAMDTACRCGVKLYDYLKREELALLNAIPTAEGCIALLLQNRSRTLWNSPVLLLGYGRCAQALAQRLVALGAQVTVAARSAAQRALARSQGCQSVALDTLAVQMGRFDTVVNTIPALVLNRAMLELAMPQALLVDLASLPGGIDLQAASECPVRAIRALSLPARCAPTTAGEFVAQAVLAMLEEEE
ncbi:MAG: dipicolinic acid synthetase [Candidatus Fournierella pullistercoris]|uniref:Dipicolinic acid synthetase n=1 Tax=Candidatus Allofournierella pullistercoris TaxID=2838597 RepID=A0A948T293_9FIRM|nr:dipicolinic acid synthetase [Candidatus Fournierella pullistercoris]